MRHNLWDRMMYRLLQEKKEKEVKASKSKGSKPDYLDLDKDGDKEEPMSKAAKEAGGKKDTPKAKKGKGKIPPQLRMYLKNKKSKKSKLDEAIERLERILINEGNFGNPVEPGTIEVGIRFSSSLVGDFTKRYGEWGGKKYDQEIKQIADKLSNFVNYDMDETREGQYVSIRTDDTEKAINFIQNAIDKKDELFNLGVGEYNFIFLKGDQVKNKNGEPLKQGEAIKFGIKDLEKLSSLEDLFVSEEGGEVSAPGAIGGGSIAESLKRLEKLLREYVGDSPGGSSIQEIERDQYASDTGSSNQFTNFEDLESWFIEHLESSVNGSEFSDKEIIDGSNFRQVQDFTYGNKDGSKILPLKKTDKAFYFKTNDDKYYMIPIGGSEETAQEINEYLSVREITEEQADAMLDEYAVNDDDSGDDDDYYNEDDNESCPDCGSTEEYDMYTGECGECGYKAHEETSDEDDPEPEEGWGKKDDDEERFKDGSCPECGYSGFDGEVCDDCGYDKTDDDDLEESVEYLSEAEVKKKQPRLGKVTRNPSGSKKKFHVYVKCGGRVKKISFGDPGLSIKRDSAARRKNFRARHKCDKPAGKDRCTARYWSCYQWRAGKKVEGEE